MVKNNKFFIKSVFKSLHFAYQRVFVIFLAIFIGACVSAGFLGIYFDIDTKMSSELKAYGANFIIIPNTDENFIHQEEYENLLKKFNKQDLIASTPFLYGFYNLGVKNGIVAGVDFNGLKKCKPFLEIRQGSMSLSDFTKDSAFLGINLAKSLEVKIGDSITITNPKNLESQNVIVKGIFYGGDESDELMYIDIKKSQALIEKNIINYANAVVKGDFKKISKISHDLSDENISAKPIAQISLSEGAILNKIKSLMALISIIVLIISSTSVNTTLSSIILSRKKEIALHEALGAKKTDIVYIFGSEILLLSVFASVLGALCGYFLSQILGYLIFKTGIDFRVMSVVLAIVISMICSVLAAYYPLKQALKIKIIDNLRGE